MPRISVWLNEETVKALGAVAVADRRRVADEAAVLLERVLDTKAPPQRQDHEK